MIAEGSSDFWVQQESCTYGPTAAVDRRLKNCTSSRQTKSGLEEGKCASSLPIPRELLLIDNFWEMEIQFALSIWLLVGAPHSSGRKSMWVMWAAQTGLDVF